MITNGSYEEESLLKVQVLIGGVAYEVEVERSERDRISTAGQPFWRGPVPGSHATQLLLGLVTPPSCAFSVRVCRSAQSKSSYSCIRENEVTGRTPAVIGGMGHPLPHNPLEIRIFTSVFDLVATYGGCIVSGKV
jgi:hypothetical protein